MKNAHLFLFTVIALSGVGFNGSVYGVRESAVTYTLSGGRLGDSFLSLLHAEWYAYQNDLPLLYKPFPYSDQLMVHELREQYEPRKRFQKTIELQKNEYVKFDKTSNTLYVIPYFPESLEEFRIQEFDPFAGKVKSTTYMYGTVDWDDKGFLKRIREIMRPRFALKLIVPPSDCLSVAVQVRRNSGGFDLPLIQGLPDDMVDPQQIYADRVFPLKCPAHDYYFEHIRLILRMFPDEKIYIHLFTDDPDPKAIAEFYQQVITDPRVTFDYRKMTNNHYSNVLEDFFSILNFDCFIRPDSNFGIAASRIGDFKVVISPLTHRWNGTQLMIDKVALWMKPEGVN